MNQPKKKKWKGSPHKPVQKLPQEKPLNFRLWAFIVFVLAFVLYANTISHEYVLDDYGVLKDNWITKRGIDGIPTLLTTSYRYGVNMLTDNLYRPLTLVMYAVEWQIAPDTPALNHFVNVLFYALSCVLLLVFLRKLFRNMHPLWPILITLLWAAHPIHTEVVANIKSRDEIMAVFFVLLASIGFIEYLRKKRIILLLGSAIAYFLAFTSKEGIITMLAIFPLMGWYFTRANTRTNIVASVVMIIPAIAYLLIRYAILSEYAQPSSVPVVDNLLMAAPDLSARYATAIYILGKYFLLLLFPIQLVSDYSYNQIPVTGWIDPFVWLSFLIYAAMIIYSFVNLKKKSILVFGILFFLITFSVYSNIFIIIGSSFGERFLVNEDFPLPLKELFKKYKVLWLVVGIILVLYSIKTVTRNSEWENQWTLFSADIQRSPNSAHLHYYWGLTIRDKAKEQTNQQEYQSFMRNAVKEFEAGLSIYPKFAECYHQLGLAMFRLGDNDKALEH